MAQLSTTDKQILEKLFQMGEGYVLNFSDRTFGEFFRDDLKIDIFDAKYKYASGSKANRLRGFWQIASDGLAAKSIDQLLNYIDTQVAIGKLSADRFPADLIQRSHSISSRLTGAVPPRPTPQPVEPNRPNHRQRHTKKHYYVYAV